MKILHLATDDKFLDQAFPVFEKVFPNANDVIVFAPQKPLRYVKLTPNYIATSRSSFFNKKPKLVQENYQNYDLIVFHSLEPSIYPELQSIPSETPTVWLARISHRPPASLAGWAGCHHHRSFAAMIA
jgi:hypothetical protein